MKIVADHKIPFLKGALEGVAELVYLPGHAIGPNDVSQADALIVRTRTRCDKALLEGSKVSFIASATIGFDHIDTTYCETHHIKWTNAPGCNANSVKQYMASALAFIIQQTGKRLDELTIGIIGAGHVGSRVHALASSLGMGTLVNDPPRARNEGPNGFVSLDNLLEEADIITMHTPLNKEGLDKTLHLADKTFFERIKKGAWFINTSRGEVADTEALLYALSTNHLGGAVIDVWEHEPHISEALLEQAAITTPHIAGYSADGKANGTTMSVRAVSKHFNLGRDDWSPSSIPDAAHMSLRLDSQGMSCEQLFIRLASHTYDIQADSDKLKYSPQTFEKQREDYPVRREPEAYRLKLLHADPSHEEIAKALGFFSAIGNSLHNLASYAIKK